ncbi:MAG: protein kinase [Planctomycetota bacterium]|nr:protein kinase [Planctomycetota bacterium]
MTDDPTRSDEPAPTHADDARQDLPPQPSILAQLEGDGHAAPQVRLREADAEEGAPPEIPLHKAADRYELVGEIARGGVGIVYKSRDRDIGRDVAMKVLRDEHAERAEVLERFVEEAQIGGQLQHPGIVPIYELGLQADNRPYFTMKLVKGDTLASILTKRAGEPGAERSTLRIFESVCQTMAYAHSRGVVHRDLKPANIMVGPFGEVQVVDWGLAKVLAAGGVADERRARKRAKEDTVVATVRTEGTGSDSVDGMIVGTPAYMPPEQALGQVDDLDERADVFSLGGILCEILTGKPPYVADDTAAVVKAVRSDLDDALARLDASQADEEMTSLARWCMQPLRGDRPQDANIVAERVGAYLTSVEERAHRSAVEQAEAEAETARTEREAAEARTRAQQARQSAKEAQARAEQQVRARRQTRAIGFAMAALLAVGVGAWMWVRAEDRAVRTAAREQVAAALAEAAFFEETESWDAAVGAARKAVQLASSGKAPFSVQREAQETFDRLDRLQRIVEAQKQRDDRDRELVRRLESIRALRLDDDSLREWDRRYEIAFAEHGLDVNELDPQTLGRKLTASLERTALAGFLDEWALLRRYGLGMPTETWEPLMEAASIAGGGGWRAQLRSVLRSGSRSELEALARSASYADAASVALLCQALIANGANERAMDLLRKAQQAHPDDVWLNVLLAQQLARQDPPNWAEAVRFYDVARALRPDSAHIHAALGHGLANLGEVSDATSELRKAVQLQPRFAYALNELGRLVLAAEGPQAALPYVAQALAADPSLAKAHATNAEVLRRLGRTDEARDAARRSIQLDTDLVDGHESLFLVLSDAEDLEGAMAALERAARVESRRGRWKRAAPGAPKGPQPADMQRVLRGMRDTARQAAVASYTAQRLEREGEWAKAITAWRQILEANPKSWVAKKRLATVLVLVPDGTLRNLEEAEGLATQTLARSPDNAAAHIVLGVIRLERGDAPGAEQAFTRALAGAGATQYRPHAHFGLARAHAAQNAKEKAIAHFDAGTKAMSGKDRRDPLLRTLRQAAKDAVDPLR